MAARFSRSSPQGKTQRREAEDFFAFGVFARRAETGEDPAKEREEDRCDRRYRDAVDLRGRYSVHRRSKSSNRHRFHWWRRRKASGGDDSRFGVARL